MIYERARQDMKSVRQRKSINNDRKAQGRVRRGNDVMQLANISNVGGGTEDVSPHKSSLTLRKKEKERGRNRQEQENSRKPKMEEVQKDK